MSGDPFDFSPLLLTTPERARDLARTLAGMVSRLANLAPM
jgi:hypothetical protein